MNESNQTPETPESKEPISYWGYINLDELLSLQHPETDAHDELQFIIVHQTFELWFKLAIYELEGAIKHLKSNDISGGIRLLNRVGAILRTAVKGFDPLMTMSQQGYAEFRDALKPASGFQSMQFRVIETLLGFERVSSGENGEKCFYWESAVQAGATFDNFMAKYHDQLLKDYEAMGQDNLRRLMLRLTENAVGAKGVEAYRELEERRSELPELYTLAEAARDLQQALLDFRLGHHKVTVFTIGKHMAGTSDSHAAGHPSCAEYLLNVIKDRSVIFLELEEAAMS
ncbi:MAG: hypothetical protein J4G05_04940 [Chlorobi bacterium]|nr:hypothetical protein [Chlorobiota bacterium]